MYYVGVVSAAKYDAVVFYYTERSASEYFRRVLGSVPSKLLHAPTFPTFKGRSDRANRVSLFDYFAWKIVAEEGGTVMGLDSITIRSISTLLSSGAELVVGRHIKSNPNSFVMHGATAPENSKVAALIHQDSVRALMGQEIEGKHRAFSRNKKLSFGGAGYLPFLNRVNENLNNIKVVPFGVLGGVEEGGKTFYLYREDGELLHPDCRTIPCYQSSHDQHFHNVTEQSINDKTLLGRLLRETFN